MTSDVAIIGMSCLFPEARNTYDYWQNLIAGKNSIREIPPDRWDTKEFYAPKITTENKMISKWAGLIDDIRGFDFQFFSLLPEEARNMDPQCRLMLQEVWRCLEDACIPPRNLENSNTSVYMGVFSLDYLQHIARSSAVEAYACHGNYPCMIANRISHFFNLKGSSYSVDGACASSLVALHEAKLAIRSGVCDYAVVGAANLISHPWHHIAFSKCRMLSPDGQCKTFDKDANGYVRGEGVGVVLLTSKERAIKEGYRIHALVQGSAVSHSGKTRTISTPSPAAQKDVIVQALKDARASPQDIDYLEAHGTGTALGDAIECHAIGEVFLRRDSLFVGSVKTNIGHLESAAGLAGLMKVIMMLKYNKIPPHLNLSCFNPVINWKKSPIKIPLESQDWDKKKNPRMCGISSFGFGGVNTHAIIQEFIEESSIKNHGKGVSVSLLLNESTDDSPVVYPILISTRSKGRLDDQVGCWRAALRDYSPDMKDVSYTLLKGRQHLPARKAFLSRFHSDLMEPICPIELSSGPRLFAFGKVSPELCHFLNPLSSQLLDPDEEIQLMTSSTEERGAYLVAKLLISLEIEPLWILDEEDGETGLAFFKNEKEKYFYKRNKPELVLGSSQVNSGKLDTYKNLLEAFCEVDIELLNQSAELFETQYAFKKQLASVALLLKPYNYSVDFDALFSNKTCDSQLSCVIDLLLNLACHDFYNKYQIPYDYLTSHQIINILLYWIKTHKISRAQAVEMCINPHTVTTLLNKIPDFDKSAKESLTIHIGACRMDNTHSIQVGGGGNPWMDILNFLITLWLNGEDINWDKFADYFYPDASLITLPGYCFKPTPFWCN